MQYDQQNKPMRTEKMKEPLIKTIRLKDTESYDLKEISYNLTKKNIMNGVKTIYRESDLVHFILEQKLNKIDVDEKGNLIFNDYEKNNQLRKNQ